MEQYTSVAFVAGQNSAALGGELTLLQQTDDRRPRGLTSEDCLAPESRLRKP